MAKIIASILIRKKNRTQKRHIYIIYKKFYLRSIFITEEVNVDKTKILLFGISAILEYRT